MWNARGLQAGLDKHTVHSAMADVKSYMTNMRSDVEGVETPFDVHLDAQVWLCRDSLWYVFSKQCDGVLKCVCFLVLHIETGLYG